MTRTTKIFFAFAAFCMMATLAHAAPFHYNVDDQTRPGGAVELVVLAAPTAGVNSYTFHFGAHNQASYTEQDVLLLLQFAYDPSNPLVFNDGTDVWSFGGESLSYPGLLDYSMSDTDAPLSWTKTSPTRTGTLLATDGVPYVQIGDILGGATTPFDLTVNVSEGFNNFDIVGSFVALPEPSTLALLGVGAIGLLAMRRRRK